MRRTLVLLTISAIPALFAGCGFNGGDKTLEEIVEQAYRVDPAAELRITNSDGSIRIYGADTTEIKIEAIKKAYSAKRLARISVNVSARPDSVSIETNFPPAKKWGFGDRSGTVDYVLVVPQTCVVSKLNLSNGEVLIEGMRSSNVHAHLESGRLFAHNCFGNISLTTGEGGIDIYYDWWEDDQKFSIDAAIVNGGARVFIPIDAAFHLIAESEDGHVANDFAEKEQRQPGGVSKIDKVIGQNAEVEIRLRAKNGSIKVGEITY